MSTNLFGRIDACEILINDSELSSRLYRGVSLDEPEISQCAKKLYERIDCRFCALKSEVRILHDDNIDIGFGSINSRHLMKNLKGCGEAFIFAVTLGFSVERYLSTLSVSSVPQYYITDALASCIVEAACDKVENILAGSIPKSNRFSPGYGDFDISYQLQVINFIRADKLLGITLTKTGLMLPQKTITAVVGIKNEQIINS